MRDSQIDEMIKRIIETLDYDTYKALYIYPDPEDEEMLYDLREIAKEYIGDE